MLPGASKYKPVPPSEGGELGVACALESALSVRRQRRGGAARCVALCASGICPLRLVREHDAGGICPLRLVREHDASGICPLHSVPRPAGLVAWTARSLAASWAREHDAGGICPLRLVREHDASGICPLHSVPRLAGLVAQTAR